MPTLTIRHTAADGTLLEGTTPADGAAEIVKTRGWRWSRRIGSWYVPRSRFQPADREHIRDIVAALEAADFPVTVVIETDQTPATLEQREAHRAAAAAARAERLKARADRHAATAADAYAEAKEAAGRIPFGQPILAGHHSQGRAERDAAGIRRNIDKAIKHNALADEAGAAARAAEAATAFRYNPQTVARRVDRLEALLRMLRRRAATSEETPDALQQRLAEVEAECVYWQKVSAQQLANGHAADYSSENVSKGDEVKVRGRWYRVARTNQKSVSVEKGTTTGRTPWHEVQDHRATPGDPPPA